MIKIKEHQNDKYNPSDYQERVIEYSSWEDYCKDIIQIDGMVNKSSCLSIPRQTQPYNIHKYTNGIVFEFEHRVLRKIIVHEAMLIN